MNPYAYAAICVVLPSLWALVIYFAFGWLDRRRRQATPAAAPPGTPSTPGTPGTVDDERPPVDYMI